MYWAIDIAQDAAHDLGEANDRNKVIACRRAFLGGFHRIRRPIDLIICTPRW